MIHIEAKKKKEAEEKDGWKENGGGAREGSWQTFSALVLVSDAAGQIAGFWSSVFLWAGDLSDAKYFDFISAAQFATITRAMENGQQIFEELVGAEGEKTVVKYASSAPNIPALHKPLGSLW